MILGIFNFKSSFFQAFVFYLSN